ncbi:MAG: VOC family protein [Alphaproteobacteria bacterium]
MTYPRAFSHIGITVTDLDKAVEWYHDVLGAYIIMPPTVIPEDDSTIGRLCTDIFGPGYEKFRIAHMTTVDGIGLELFEFSNPKSERRENNFEYWKTGVFHFCVTDPDIEGLANKIAETGGKHRSKIWQFFPDKPYKMTYCEDPWGNILEIYTHAYEAIYSNRVY